ncbi:MAG: HEAT repeat domain-containing protein, partial [Planctomycetales bacterium]|nr:HEAT repeat domain-containing protein [Planctomycetales bacterium]
MALLKIRQTVILGVFVAAASFFSAMSGELRAQQSGGDRYLQQQVIKLLGELEAGNVFKQRNAAKELNAIRPTDVKDKALRKQVAQAFRKAAFADHADDWAVEGLVHWGGKYSVPLVLQLLERDRMRSSDAIYDALARYPTEESAQALARQLGDFFNHDNAVRCLRRFGPVAEDALIEAAPSNEPKVSLAAVELLGDLGTQKSLPILRKAAASRNRNVSDLAKASIRRISKRGQEGAKPENAASDSPFDDAPASVGSGRDDTGRDGGDDDDEFGSMAEEAGDRGDGDDDLAWDDATAPSESTCDWSQIVRHLPGAPVGGFVPDGAEAAPTWEPRPVRLATGDQFRGESLQTMGIGGSEELPIAVSALGSLHRDEICRLQVYDLRRRRQRADFVGPKGVEWCEVSPTGERAVHGSIEDFSKQTTRLTIWTLGKQPVRVRDFTPYESARSQGAWGRVEQAFWGDEDQLFTVGPQGDLVLWNLGSEKPQAVYQIDVQ